jgi:hypothetical protein
MRPVLTVVVGLALSTAAVALAASVSSAYFLGAPAGVEVPFEFLNLPPPTPAAVFGDLPDAPFLRSFAGHSPFSPTLHQLLEGETVITTEKQMREVWERLFSVPYDAAQFDFATTFVVLMGGGPIANGTFAISAVEEVEASYANPGGLDGDPASEAFLSITATTFLNGAQPKNPPPADWRLSAIKVSRDLQDDVVFRRNTINGV